MFVPYEKRSKKEKQKANAEKRSNWGNVKPVTKVKPSKKIYNRKRSEFNYD